MVLSDQLDRFNCPPLAGVWWLPFFFKRVVSHIKQTVVGTTKNNVRNTAYENPGDGLLKNQNKLKRLSTIKQK